MPTSANPDFWTTRAVQTDLIGGRGFTATAPIPHPSYRRTLWIAHFNVLLFERHLQLNNEYGVAVVSELELFKSIFLLFPSI